ncbi:hypothetical protein ACFSO7_17740 [Bacillus sp. CGMCC 1.16607]|uniref:hypothetical protein n=1 Tax=Bacillus sp. CGMCC 1.16607 TaxID=3351842 RepID=UPI00363D2416
MLPQNMGSETNVKLPFSFFFFSMVALLLSQTILVLNTGEFASGNFRTPAIWSAAHLFILGWALMVAMGSMYQLVPVAFLTPIWNEKFGYVQFGVSSVGIISFASFLFWSPQHALIPGVLTVLGIFMFLIQMLMTLRNQARPNILTVFVGTGLLCLFLTIFFGIALIISWKTGLLGAGYQAFFKSHLLLGVGGWFTFLIFGFSYKMVPMFSLSHGYSMGLAKYVYICYVTGIVVTIISFFTNESLLMKLGFFLLFIGFSLFAWHVSMIIKKRIKRKLDKPFMFALSGIGFGVFLHALFFLNLFTQNKTNLIGPLLFLYLMLWIVLSILGYLYKIVPFLWWTHKYSKEIGKKTVPALKDMLNENLAVTLLSILILSCFIIYLGFIIQISAILTIGIVLLALSILSTAISILLVILNK